MFAAAVLRKRASRRPTSRDKNKDHPPIENIPEDVARDYELEMLMLDGTWQRRRIVWTKELIAFARVKQQILIDKIPLTEILSIQDMASDLSKSENTRKQSILQMAASSAQGFSLRRNSAVSKTEKSNHHEEELNNVQSRDFLGKPAALARQVSHYVSCDVISAAFEGRGNLNTLQIETVRDGFNLGRTYYLRAPTESKCKDIVVELTSLSVKAKKKAEVRTRMIKYQRKFRKVYNSLPFQSCVGLLIMLNFATNVADVQISRDSSLHVQISNLDIFFTAIFTAELLINAFANWFTPFVSNRWNIFDFIVILLSLIALGISNLPVSILRLVRAFRVIRLFGRMKALKNILSSLSASIKPELNAFMIMFIVISIYAVVGVTFFSELAPDEYATFEIAFITLFRISAGDPWSLPITNSDGSTNYGVVFFFISYIMLVNWTLLQACVAVLVDNFISSSAQSLMEEQERIKDEKKKRMVIKSSLDPLLARLINDYTDDKDLCNRLHNLFKVLDKNDSQLLACDEFCVGIKKLNFIPRIHVTESDFMILTKNGSLCDAAGQMRSADFEFAMREQIKLYVQRKLTDCLTHEDFSDAKLAQVGALKVVLHELLRQSDQSAQCQPKCACAGCTRQSEGASADTQESLMLLTDMRTMRSELQDVLSFVRSGVPSAISNCLPSPAEAPSDVCKDSGAITLACKGKPLVDTRGGSPGLRAELGDLRAELGEVLAFFRAGVGSWPVGGVPPLSSRQGGRPSVVAAASYLQNDYNSSAPAAARGMSLGRASAVAEEVWILEESRLPPILEDHTISELPSTAADHEVSSRCQLCNGQLATAGDGCSHRSNGQQEAGTEGNRKRCNSRQAVVGDSNSQVDCNCRTGTAGEDASQGCTIGQWTAGVSNSLHCDSRRATSSPGGGGPGGKGAGSCSCCDEACSGEECCSRNVGGDGGDASGKLCYRQQFHCYSNEGQPASPGNGELGGHLNGQGLAARPGDSDEWCDRRASGGDPTSEWRAAQSLQGPAGTPLAAADVAADGSAEAAAGLAAAVRVGGGDAAASTRRGVQREARALAATAAGANASGGDACRSNAASFSHSGVHAATDAVGANAATPADVPPAAAHGPTSFSGGLQQHTAESHSCCGTAQAATSLQAPGEQPGGPALAGAEARLRLGAHGQCEPPAEVAASEVTASIGFTSLPPS